DRVGKDRPGLRQTAELMVRTEVVGMVDERHDRAGQHDQQARQHPDPQQPADGQLDLADLLLVGCGAVVGAGGGVGHHNPFNSISIETHNKTITNTLRMTELCSRPSRREPVSAPVRTPMATGPATNGSTWPRAK